MMHRKFGTIYHPDTQISLDESTMPFKGRVGFKCYNPKKPNRVHIKMFMVSEAKTGYICGLRCTLVRIVSMMNLTAQRQHLQLCIC